MRIIYLILLCPIFCFAQTESIFWKVEHPDLDHTSYLFGTYHLMNDGFLEKGANNALKAFKSSNVILVESRESDYMDPQVMQRYFSGSPSISEELSKKDSLLVDSIIQKRLNDQFQNYDRMKPVMLAVFIGLTYHQDYLDDHGNYDGIPIDRYFDVDATKREIPVYSLENPIESFSYLLDSISQKTQLEYLVLNCLHDSAMYRIAGIMYESYRANDVKTLLAISDYYDDLVTDITSEYVTAKRNKLWLDRLDAYLTEEACFVAVGSLHLPYEYGLVTLLRNNGYEVTPLTLK